MNYYNPFLNSPKSDQQLSPEHGGPILCLDYQKDLAVTGSTDHGLRVYSLISGKQVKELYNKNYGHTEWVTCVSFLNDGRVVSGGMDSNICIWDSKGVRCKMIAEHTGSISKIKVDDIGIIMSSSYDTTIRIFDSNNSNCLGILKGIHRNPITEFEWKNSLCVAGSRDGLVSLWDINTQKCLSSQSIHNGQISRIKFHSDELNSNLIITTGINDGLMNIIDMRTNNIIFSKQIHKGAINFLETNKDNFVITGSADKTIKIIDLNKFKEMNIMKVTDAVFCGEIYNNYIAVGCGDGNMLGYNLDTGECIYGYGCDNKGSVKCLKINPERKSIITGGDSGEALQLLF